MPPQKKTNICEGIVSIKQNKAIKPDKLTRRKMWTKWSEIGICCVQLLTTIAN